MLLGERRKKRDEGRKKLHIDCRVEGQVKCSYVTGGSRGSCDYLPVTVEGEEAR